MRPLMLAMLPGIETSEILHLPKLQEPITLANIQNLPQFENRVEQNQNLRYILGEENEYDPQKYSQIRLICS